MMDLSGSQDALIALMGTIFGGAGLELVRRMLAKSKEREDSATALRSELRADISTLKAEFALVEKDLDLWRNKYYELYQTYIRLETQYNVVVRQIADAGVIKDKVVFPKTPLKFLPEIIDTADPEGVES